MYLPRRLQIGCPVRRAEVRSGRLVHGHLVRQRLRACRPRLLLLLCATDSNSANGRQNKCKNKCVCVDIHRRTIVAVEILQKTPLKKFKNGSWLQNTVFSLKTHTESILGVCPCKKIEIKKRVTEKHLRLQQKSTKKETKKGKQNIVVCSLRSNN